MADDRPLLSGLVPDRLKVRSARIVLDSLAVSVDPETTSPHAITPTGDPQVRDYVHMLALINAVLTTAPGFDKTGLVGFPTLLPLKVISQPDVDVDGLRPDRWYWYRFAAGDARSPIGRTRTAPAAGEATARLGARREHIRLWLFPLRTQGSIPRGQRAQQ